MQICKSKRLRLAEEHKGCDAIFPKCSKLSMTIVTFYQVTAFMLLTHGDATCHRYHHFPKCEHVFERLNLHQDFAVCSMSHFYNMSLPYKKV